jgi:hypothetical protein
MDIKEDKENILVDGLALVLMVNFRQPSYEFTFNVDIDLLL